MARFVALLRGVNVGKGNRVPMAEFRAALEDLGHGAVRTLLNSGNAVFSAPARKPQTLAAGVAEVLQQRFGVSTPVVVKSAAEFAAIVDHNPIAVPAPEHSRFLVVFAMEAVLLRELDRLQPLVQAGERLVVTDLAAYLHCAGGLLESRVGEAVLGKAGRGLTTRNWATVLKISALLGEPAA